MGEDERFVDCDEHGHQVATFVCMHVVQTLSDGQPRGFWWADEPDKFRPDAWCTACEAKVQETGGEWNDENEAFAGVTLLCGSCYDEVRNINADAAGDDEPSGNRAL